MHPFTQSPASEPAPLPEPLELLDPPLLPSTDASEALPGGAVEPPHRAVTTINPARPAVQTG
jgi:hypothetical protein